MIITPEQLKAARAFLHWTQGDLAKASHVSIGTIKNFEAGRHATNYSSMQSLRLALETAGIEFIEQHGIKKGK